MKKDYLTDPRFDGLAPFASKMWLASPTMHGEEQKWVDDAIATNWVSTVGANINEVEKQVAEKVGCGRGRSNAYIAGSGADVGADLFRRGLCLPSDNKMTAEQQDVVIDIIHRCFR